MGQYIGFKTSVYFIVRIGSQVSHHSMKYHSAHEDLSVYRVVRKAVRRLCKLYKISLPKLIQTIVVQAASILGTLA